MLYVSPADVATVMAAATGDADAKEDAMGMPDALYDAAVRFAHIHGLIRRTGQLVTITHEGRRYIRRYLSWTR